MIRLQDIDLIDPKKKRFCPRGFSKRSELSSSYEPFLVCLDTEVL